MLNTDSTSELIKKNIPNLDMTCSKWFLSTELPIEFLEKVKFAALTDAVNSKESANKLNMYLNVFTLSMMTKLLIKNNRILIQMK